jgi:hypothetical protein
MPESLATPPPNPDISSSPPHTQSTPPLPSTQDSSDIEKLLTPAEAAKGLRVYTEDKIKAIVHASTVLGTKDGPITNQTATSILSNSKVQFLSSKAWTLTTSEYVLLQSAFITCS